MTPSSAFDISAKLAITCPQCQAEIPLSEAISHQLQDHLNQRLGKEKRLLEKAAEQAELSLRKKQRQLEEQQQSLELDIARKLDEERGKIRDQAIRQAAEDNQLRPLGVGTCCAALRDIACQPDTIGPLDLPAARQAAYAEEWRGTFRRRGPNQGARRSASLPP